MTRLISTIDSLISILSIKILKIWVTLTSPLQNWCWRWGFPPTYKHIFRPDHVELSNTSHPGLDILSLTRMAWYQILNRLWYHLKIWVGYSLQNRPNSTYKVISGHITWDSRQKPSDYCQCFTKQHLFESNWNRKWSWKEWFKEKKPFNNMILHCGWEKCLLAKRKRALKTFCCQAESYLPNSGLNTCI